jgi:two-component system sensor histidine kinase YesM
MRKRFQFISIKTKMLVICLTVIIVPVFVMTINSYASSQSLLERKYTELLTDVAKQTNTRIDEFLYEIEKISLVASYGLNSNVSVFSEANSPIQEFLRDGNAANESAAYGMLMNYIILKDRVFSVYVYNLQGGQDLYVSSNEPLDFTHKAVEESWFRQFIGSNDKFMTLNTHADNQLRTKRLAISHARKIFDMTSGELLGVMVISVDLKFIDIANGRLQEALRSRFTIVDETNTILYSAESRTIGQPFAGSYRPDPSKQLVVATPFDRRPWTTYLSNPRKELSAEGDILRQNMYMLAALMCLFAAIISVYLSSVITRPIKKLMDNITLVEKGQFAQVEEVRSRDEIGLLSVRFHKMSYELKHLVEQIQKEEIDKAAVEMRALQSQINPHFLYNTLGSVKWIASMQRADKIVKMTEALISMLRYAARNEGAMVSVREELDNIENYLTIQNVRYYNKLHVNIDVDDKLADHRMPKLILQPIVENAIFHGLAEKEEDGAITIRIRSEEDDIAFEIHDNGAGMGEETVRAVKENLSNAQSQSKGIGLYNVQRRIQLHFGSPYGIRVESEPGAGTTFYILLPGITDCQEAG